MSFLTRDQIRTVDDMKFEVVDVPEWGGQARIRSLRGVERDQFEDFIVVTKRQGKKVTREAVMANARAKMVSLCMVDDDGNAMFTAADVDWLGQKSGTALHRVFAAAMTLNGMTEEEIDDMGEGSGRDQTDASRSS